MVAGKCTPRYRQGGKSRSCAWGCAGSTQLEQQLQAQHSMIQGAGGHVPPPRCHSWAKEKRENLPAQHCHVLPTPGEISRGNKEKARGCHCPRAWLPCGVTAPTPGETVSGGNQWRFLGFVGEIWDFSFSPFSDLFTVPP